MLLGRSSPCSGETTLLILTGLVNGDKASSFRLVRVELYKHSYRGFVSWQVTIRCSTDAMEGRQGPQGYSPTGQVARPMEG